MISVEACGGNAKGVYHNAVGKDVTALEAKSDVLWNELRARGVPNVAIGDLGNEIGMGTIGEHIKNMCPSPPPANARTAAAAAFWPQAAPITSSRQPALTGAAMR